VLDVPLGTMKTDLFRAKELLHEQPALAVSLALGAQWKLAWPAAGVSTALRLSRVRFVPLRSFRSDRS